MKNIVERLTALLKERKNADPSSSYVASLYAKGNEKIIEKIAEAVSYTHLTLPTRRKV